MKLLLDDEFAPITSQVGFLEADLQVVGQALHRWERSQITPLLSRVIQTPVREPFPGSLLHLEPLSVDRLKCLLLATRSPWTAYFDSGRDGPDPVPIVSHLCIVLGCRGLAVTCVPNTLASEAKGNRGRYGSVQFQLFGPSPTRFLNYVRTIEASNDGGRWEFGADGEQQPFERPAQYKARRIADRFTSELLDEYCSALGVQYFDPSFYEPRGILIEVRHHIHFTRSARSLGEVQREMGIR